MISIKNVKVFNIDGAIRGMRNPINSWDKSDSVKKCPGDSCQQFDCDVVLSLQNAGEDFCIGKNDMELMKTLFKAGTSHRKYLRQIFICFDVTAPLYWWKEFDTYKVGTVANSCSTMHKLHSRNLTLNDFSYEHLADYSMKALINVIGVINSYRRKYIEYKDKFDWWQMIQLLPSSYNQRRTITLDYENLVNIMEQRKEHKLDEWRIFYVEMLKANPLLCELMEV